MDDTAPRAPGLVLVAASLLLALVAAPAAAQVSYTRNANGSWTSNAAWTPNGVPGPGDYANLAGRTVTLDTDVEVAGLSLPSNGSVLTGAGTLTVTESVAWQGGYLQGSGTLVVADGANLAVTGTWDLGLREQRVLQVLGTASWSSNRRLSNSSESHFINEGTVTITAGLPVADALFFAGTFTNKGTLVLDSSGTFDFASFFHNQGEVQVQSGRLWLRGFNSNGGTDTGSYAIADGAVLEIGGGNRSLTATTTVAGKGTLEVRTGTTSIAGSVDVAILRMPADGILNLDGHAAVDVLQLSGLGAKLGGSGNLAVRDALAWSGGAMQGSGSTTLAEGAPASLSGSSLKLYGTRTLLLQGATEWTADTDFSNHADAALVNAGTLTSSGTGERVFFGGTFRNEGTLLHGGGTLRFSSRFDNVGVVEVGSGLLQQSGFNATGGTEAGTTLVAAGAELDFAGGHRILTSAALLAGSGSIVHSGGSLQHSATVAPGSSPGTLAWTAAEYAPLADAHLAMEIAGTAPGSGHDLLAVDGDVVLGGSLEVQFTDGFVPGPADSFVLLTATGEVVGGFVDTSLPPGYVLQLEPDAVVLQPAVLEVDLFSDGFEAMP